MPARRFKKPLRRPRKPTRSPQMPAGRHKRKPRRLQTVPRRDNSDLLLIWVTKASSPNLKTHEKYIRKTMVFTCQTFSGYKSIRMRCRSKLDSILPLKICQNPIKKPPGHLQDASKMCRDATKTTQDALKTPQDAPKPPQGTPKMPRNAPKISQNAP